MTPNADPTVQNIRFIGSDDPNEKLEDLVLNKINPSSQKRKIRPDAVWCVELLLTASPEYFRPDNPTHGGYYDPTRMKEWLTANQQYLNQTWGERIVRAELHLDEMTPHIHAYRRLCSKRPKNNALGNNISAFAHAWVSGAIA